MTVVSISESRCFSFQEGTSKMSWLTSIPFQSRNRDAFRFKDITAEGRSDGVDSCFNLGIEMLFVSSTTRVLTLTRSGSLFQSRNRDAFRFKLSRHQPVGAIFRFNLGIEMLFVSSRFAQP